MIVTEDDLRQATHVVEDVCLYYKASDGEADSPQDPVLFAERPHLLMVLGYDEFRALEGEISSDQDDAEVRQMYGLADYFSAYDYESVYRDITSGAWYWYKGMSPEYLHFKGPLKDPNRYTTVQQWLDILRRIHAQPDPTRHTLWLPSTWTPRIQREQRSFLSDAVGGIMQAVHDETRALRDIPWRQLEELVAELLRARGLQIFVTPRSGDGGRDIIARGELIPGEPTILAVEVKQKPVVGLADVQRALRANEDFPALMLATAGRFSAGVVREKKRTRNRLRLFLKDGIALTQWIDTYMNKKQTPEIASHPPNTVAPPGGWRRR